MSPTLNCPKAFFNSLIIKVQFKLHQRNRANYKFWSKCVNYRFETLKINQERQCRQLNGTFEGVKKLELWSQLTDLFNLSVAPE